MRTNGTAIARRFAEHHRFFALNDFARNQPPEPLKWWLRNRESYRSHVVLGWFCRSRVLYAPSALRQDFAFLRDQRLPTASERDHTAPESPDSIGPLQGPYVATCGICEKSTHSPLMSLSAISLRVP
ncbi:hypothetical protein FHR32_006625 [Streptosporangium album]|uniref:Uncharacterized protein n=1 Tax=Streptosporangium album TaxID=47479 RepID=A0A7W7WDE3_9ACTN|nr:hypothetical protein [Streptosporangium album]